MAISKYPDDGRGLPETLASVAPDKAALWHPDRNGALTPETVRYGSKRRIWWRCGRGHEWQTSVYSLTTMGTGCPYCSGRFAIPGETDLATTHPHIAALWHPANRLSPGEVSAGSHKRVRWRCHRGHEWDAVIASVAVEGCDCPYCAGKLPIPGETDLATVRPDIAAQWDLDRNGSMTPRSVLPSSHDRAWWKCAQGHSWEAMVFSRTREKAAGCPYCTGRKVLAGFNDLATLKPKLAEEWHQALNGELTPEKVTLGSNKKVWWQCGDGHVWRAAVYSRTRRRGSGCPVCAGSVKEVPLPVRRQTQSRHDPVGRTAFVQRV